MMEISIRKGMLLFFNSIICTYKYMIATVNVFASIWRHNDLVECRASPNHCVRVDEKRYTILSMRSHRLFVVL